MSNRELTGAAFVFFLLMRSLTASAADDATIFRVFLKDGRSLVSYGEVARVESRVVFSMPMSAGAKPSLRLVDIPADQVDWDRTDRYAATARSGRYLETQAEIDYTALSNQITQTLTAVGETTDTTRRLELVQQARKALADWPLNHYNYRESDIRQLLTLLDQAIADLRLTAGATARFDLNLVAVSSPPPVVEPLLPEPTEREMIEQTVIAAHFAESTSERVSLLRVAAKELARTDVDFPVDWATTTRAAVRGEIATEARIDRSYQALTMRMTNLADQRARNADVLGVERVIARIYRRDAWLGACARTPSTRWSRRSKKSSTPRGGRLARDRWALRAPDLATYRAAISRLHSTLRRAPPGARGHQVALAGSSPSTLERLDRLVAWILKRASEISPPDELTSPHAVFVSAVHMAENAAIIRREATLASSVERAWDASSAAAGALMLGTRAQSDMRAVFRPPQLP